MTSRTTEPQTLAPLTTVKPEEQELARKREEQAAIETELAECELRAANLRAELGAFERRYLHFVGPRYTELDELNAQIAEEIAKSQPDNFRAQQTAREARSRASSTKTSAGERTEQEPKPFQASLELKRLYREVARRVHPDLTSDRDDRAKRQELMAQANEAYEQGNEAQLTKILTDYECSPEAVKGEGTAPDLIRVIRRISQARSRLSEIEAELQELLRCELHQLRMRVSEAENRGRDVVKEIVTKVDEQITQAKRRLENLQQRAQA
jgi:hypothetical protein